MFGLADLKKINERAAEKAGQRHTNKARSLMREGRVVGAACSDKMAQEIADALNLADAVAEANANAVGRT